MKMTQLLKLMLPVLIAVHASANARTTITLDDGSTAIVQKARRSTSGYVAGLEINRNTVSLITAQMAQYDLNVATPNGECFFIREQVDQVFDLEIGQQKIQVPLVRYAKEPISCFMGT